jgi:penicillin amidase
MRVRRLLSGLAIAGAALWLSACAALFPAPAALDQRLATFAAGAPPVGQPVEILWDDHQIPYVIAANDRDAAFALGMIQAHLRGGELALARHVVRGRLSELGGPGLNEADHALRILDFGRAAEAAIARMPPATKAWLEAFVAGINWFEAEHGVAFPEAGLLGLDREPYTAADVIAIGRLGGMDVNWPVYRDLAAQWGKPGFAEAFARVVAAGSGNGDASPGRHERFEALAWAFARRGSNAWAVAPSRSASGAAMLAADPHLSVSIPGVWIAVGIRAPGLQAVGLMPLGVPVIAIGRTASIAWAGTNMHAATSELTDVSGLPPDEIQSRPTRIATRFWFDAVRTLRETKFGPIVSDAAILELGGRTLALRWAGHLPTDELTAMLALPRAATPEAFRAALAPFGQPPQNMIFATASGQIGEAFATTQSDRARYDADSFIRDASSYDPSTERLVTATGLPLIVDPPEGIVVTANDAPPTGGKALGFTFAGRARAERIAEVLNANAKLAPADLMALQRDTMSREAGALAQALSHEIARLGLAAEAPGLTRRLAAWNGDYAVDSAGAPAFEILLAHVLPRLHGVRDADALDPIEKEWEVIARFLPADLAALPEAQRRAVLRAALRGAAPQVASIAVWGDLHRMPMAHTLADIPVIGGFFDYGSYPVGGSRQTPMKTAHGLLDGRGPVEYGSSARFVTDMGGPDDSWLVLFGGQDGWLGSDTMLDQVPLWRRGEYIRMPLGDAAIRAQFTRATPLLPAAATR